MTTEQLEKAQKIKEKISLLLSNKANVEKHVTDYGNDVKIEGVMIRFGNRKSHSSSDWTTAISEHLPIDPKKLAEMYFQLIDSRIKELEEEFAAL